MRTLPIAETDPAVAWLESTPREGQETIRAELAKFPFVIGRNESCDLTIESARISREHVRIEIATSGYLVRDLGSTNGTFVNGVKIKEAALNDGDLLTVANYGLVFHLPRGEAGSSVTQAFTQVAESSGSIRQSSVELIEVARALQEMCLNRAVRNRLQAVVEVAHSEPIGYEIGAWSVEGGHPAGLSRLPDNFDSPAVARAYDLSRRLAVEQVWTCFGDVLMFLSASGKEIGSPELLDSLERLKQRPAGEARLVVQVPHDALAEAERFEKFRQQLREIGVSSALDRFAGGASSLGNWRDSPPDYLKLAPSVVEGLSRSPDQRRRVQELIQAARDMGTKVIGCGVKTEEEWHACKGVGIEYAQGEYAAASLPLDACAPGKR
jgi:EAL domain-containing protein (putative c-di-GMP-specific phosphodiesterase class I)